MAQELGRRIKTLQIAMVNGGIGDNIARLTAIKACIKEHPDLFLIILARDNEVELFKHCLPPTPLLQYKAITNYDRSMPCIDFNSEQFTSRRMHPVDNAFIHLLDRLPKESERYYLQAPRVDLVSDLKGYICLAPISMWENKRMHYSFFIDAIRYWGHNIIWIGKEQKIKRATATLAPELQLYVNSVGYNLINKLSLVETLGIIQHSEGILCSDGGLLHLAGLTDVCIETYIALKEPSLIMPIRKDSTDIIHTPNLPCEFCHSKEHFIDWDYSYCRQGHNNCAKVVNKGE